MKDHYINYKINNLYINFNLDININLYINFNIYINSIIYIKTNTNSMTINWSLFKSLLF